MRNALTVILAALFALLATSTMASAREVKMATFPAISADGATLYFTCWGDLWSAPRDGSAPARRLTDNVAYDGRPILSPDGTRLLFVSDRFGSYDLFVMPATGGPATRLTFNSTTDYPYGWKADGSAVLEYAVLQDLWGNCIYEIPLDADGAAAGPRRITGPDHQDNVFASYLDGAQSVVFARGAGDWTRRNYSGSSSYDLWRLDLASRQYQRLTQEPGNEMWPQPAPDGQTVYFVSDRDGSCNLWALDAATGDQRQLTHFDGEGVNWPRISSDGDEMIFERAGELHVLTLATGELDQPQLSFDGDYKHEMLQTADMPNSALEYSLAPNGKYFAVVVMGDLYILKNAESYPEDEQPDQDLSRSIAAVTGLGREMQPAWAPDSTRLAYISDRPAQGGTRQFDVFVYDLVSRQETQVTATAEDEWWPMFSPLAKRDAEKQWLACYQGNTKLMLHDLKGGGSQLLHEGVLRTGPWALGYEWAPDGQWLAYADIADNDMADVYIISVAEDGTGGTPVNVTFSPDWEDGATWSKDSKWLACNRWQPDGGEVLLLELNPEKETYDTELLFPEDLPAAPEAADAAAESALEADTPVAAEADEPVDAEGEDAQQPEAGEEASPDDAAEPEEKAPEPVVIDFTRINLRCEAVTEMEGSAYGAFFDPSSKVLLFVTNHEGREELWAMTLEEREFSPLGDVEGQTSPQFAPDSSKLYFLQGGAINYVALTGTEVSGGGGVALTSRVTADQYAIWEQMLEEGWRHLRDGFYDEKMHGVDWDEVRTRYLSRIRECGSPEEFGLLMRKMLGELGGSHLGFYSGASTQEAPAEVTADFGVDFDESFGGPGWRVKQVITGGPADQPASRLAAGDIITAVNGNTVNASADRGLLLNNLAGQVVVLTVVRDEPAAAPKLAGIPDDKQESFPAGERQVTIKPVPSFAMGQLRYEQWVENNRQAVYESGGGAIGYQHIQGMDGPSLEKFRRELFSESYDKQALIIDVRFNGGGYIHEDLINILDQRPFAQSQMRNGQRRTHPILHWSGPVVVLINPGSYSDAEIFPHIMRELGLATLIGEPTGGNVIGTYDFQLLDGSGFRLPAEGWWLLDDTNMEGHGAQPDLLVPFDEGLYAEGRDNQLEAAVDFLKGKL